MGELTSMTTTPPTRIFLGWNAPVLDTTVTWLAREWEGGGPLDLSGHLVVVPTRQAGRRLREGLARHAATRGAGVLCPLVVTPNQLFAPTQLTDRERPVASPQTARLLWGALLLKLPSTAFRRLFPVEPVVRDLAWADRHAAEFLEVRDLLIESGLDFRAAADRMAASELETARWQELAALEAAAVALIEASGFQDPGIAALNAARTGTVPVSIRHLVVAAVPDLRPLAAEALLHHGTGLPVTILVPAPASEANSFDNFGRPRETIWRDREIAFADPAATLHSCTHPLAQADLCRKLLALYEEPAATAAIGLPDPELAPTLEHRFDTHGLPTYDPAGRAVSREGIVHLLRLTSELLATERYQTFQQLLRCPGFAAAMLPHSRRGSLQSGRLLGEADQLAADHLPGDLGDALDATARHPGKFNSITAALEETRAFIARLRAGDFTEELCAFLGDVFAERRLSPHDPESAVLKEVAAAIHALETDLTAAAPAFPKKPGSNERFYLLLASLGDCRIHLERKPRDLDLQGWLELIWEDARHLLITGMNDHAVPESLVGHAFLPDAARTRLGVPDNGARFARDAFVLTLLVETRRKNGRLDLLFGRFSATGDPLRPSRLLFQCQDRELAARTLDLFRKSETGDVPPARTLAWQLKPAPLPADHTVFTRISVTQFKTYLACPFRFYLKHGLRMKAVDVKKRELDANDFGTAIHHALEAFGRDEELRRATDAPLLEAAFVAEIDRWFSRQFGRHLSTPLLIQREAARRRLARWAAIEAEQRAQGWEILEVEAKLGKTESWAFEIDGMPVTGQIDRIERHPTEGLRVLDFKTLSPMENGRRKTVDHFHLVNVKRTEDPESFPAWSRTVDAKGKERRWTDLQVPLYYLALSQRFPGETITAGYVTLGRTAEEVGIDLWTGLDESLLSSAQDCAIGVIRAVREGIFWPANERMPEWDEFRAMLSPTAAAAIDPTSLGRATSPV
jgi:ATP-dependent helicase/nuclease subunit B